MATAMAEDSRDNRHRIVGQADSNDMITSISRDMAMAEDDDEEFFDDDDDVEDDDLEV